MLTTHLAIVSQTDKVSVSDTAVVAAAIQKQVTRDFAPLWGIEATVQAFPSLAVTPSDYVPIVIKDELTSPRASGVHRSTDNQVFALVDFGDLWSVTVSHEVLELLVDPSLNRVVAGPSLKPGQGRVNYLVEVCDPCQEDFYEVNGVKVCDFCTRDYFEPAVVRGVRCNFLGTISRPWQLRPGGYLSWQVPESGEWWMGFQLSNGLTFVPGAPPNAAMSLRQFIDGESKKRRGYRRQRKRPRPLVSKAVTAASASRAAWLQEEISGAGNDSDV